MRKIGASVCCMKMAMNLVPMKMEVHGLERVGRMKVIMGTDVGGAEWVVKVMMAPQSGKKWYLCNLLNNILLLSLFMQADNHFNLLTDYDSSKFIYSSDSLLLSENLIVKSGAQSTPNDLLRWMKGVCFLICFCLIALFCLNMTH